MGQHAVTSFGAVESARELVLGIESSCDETAAAVVASGRSVISSIVESQSASHAPYGGVVPEIAGRSHLRSIVPVIDRAMRDAGVDWPQIAAIAVTNRPGLIGSLLVGLTAAKALAWAKSKPLIPIDHIEAHVHAATMERDEWPYPCLALVVSGGHTALYQCDSPLELRWIGATMDDAAGEAFDKVASLLGLGYPGGPEVARLAREGNRVRFAFPRYRSKLSLAQRLAETEPSDAHRLRMAGDGLFSFSGLKTAVLYQLRGQNGRSAEDVPAPANEQRVDVAASFEEAVVDALVEPTIAGARELGLRRVLVAGGVACNRRLRERMQQAAGEAGLEAWFPSPAYCTDNAAMIAGLGWHAWRAGRGADLALDASPRRM